MKKIKKFFRYVFGEIKEPSEDAGKVLDVIQRVILVIIAIVLILKITSIASTIYFTIIPYMQNGIFDNFENTTPYIIGWIFELVRLAAYIFLFVSCREMVKTGKKVNKLLFIITFVILTMIHVVERNFLYENSSFSILSLILLISRYFFIYISFVPIIINKENDKSKNHEDIDKIQIWNIATFGYIFLVMLILRLGGTAISQLAVHFDTFGNAISAGVNNWWIWVRPLYALLFLLQTIVIVVIFARALKGRRSNKNLMGKNVSILAIILIVSLTSLFFIAAIDTDLFYAVAFCLAVSYQNKYKVFDDIGTRTFKKTMDKIKTVLDNYLSVGK